MGWDEQGNSTWIPSQDLDLGSRQPHSFLWDVFNVIQCRNAWDMYICWQTDVLQERSELNHLGCWGGRQTQKLSLHQSQVGHSEASQIPGVWCWCRRCTQRGIAASTEISCSNWWSSKTMLCYWLHHPSFRQQQKWAPCGELSLGVCYFSL